jgi:outer membrane protein OmpA-like peptidoglycan-associated protein
MVIVKAREMQQALASTGHINLYGILFDFNKFDVRPDSRPALDEISAFLKSNPDRKLKIVGHTDNVGGAEFNLQLSRARAAAVVNELTAKYGIDAGRLKAEGAGLTRPIATNDTDEGRARNRRVELIALN